MPRKKDPAVRADIPLVLSLAIVIGFGGFVMYMITRLLSSFWR